jgi:hypothetical protein
MRIMTFSKYDDHSSPLFKKLKIIKLFDLMTFHVSCFMHKYYHNILPSAFDGFFIVQGWPLKNLIIFLRHELIMV